MEPAKEPQIRLEWIIMDPTPENLAQLHRERIRRARKMSPEQKLIAGPQLFALAMETMRAGIRLQNPGADETQIRNIIRQRLERMRRKDEVPFHGPA